MTTISDIQIHLDAIREELTAVFNHAIEVGKLIEQMAATAPGEHIPHGSNQAVFNAIVPFIPKLRREIATAMAADRQGAYASGPVEHWGLTAQDCDEALQRLRAASLLD